MLEDGDNETLWKLKESAPNAMLPELVQFEAQAKAKWDANYGAAVKREKIKEQKRAEAAQKKVEEEQKAKQKLIEEKKAVLKEALQGEWASSDSTKIFQKDWKGVREAAESLGFF